MSGGPAGGGMSGGGIGLMSGGGLSIGSGGRGISGCWGCSIMRDGGARLLPIRVVRPRRMALCRLTGAGRVPRPVTHCSNDLTCEHAWTALCSRASRTSRGATRGPSNRAQARNGALLAPREMRFGTAGQTSVCASTTGGVVHTFRVIKFPDFTDVIVRAYVGQPVSQRTLKTAIKRLDLESGATTSRRTRNFRPPSRRCCSSRSARSFHNGRWFEKRA